MSDFSDWALILGNFGFPIVVSFYLLLRLEKRLEELSAVIRTLGKSK